MSRELTLACPLCGTPNFTVRGLRQHWCKAKSPAPGHKKHSAPLTKLEWKAAVDAAKSKEAA